MTETKILCNDMREPRAIIIHIPCVYGRMVNQGTHVNNYHNQDLCFIFIFFVMNVSESGNTHHISLAHVTRAVRNEGKTGDTFVARNRQAYF